MNESKKITELFRISTNVEKDDALITFVEEFESFLLEMKMPQNRKQLILNYEDCKPRILNINS